MNLTPKIARTAFTHRRAAWLFLLALMVVPPFLTLLTGVSASRMSWRGIAEQHHVGKWVGKVAPQPWAATRAGGAAAKNAPASPASVLAFGPLTTFGLGLPPSIGSPQVVVAADFNRDGKPDLAVAESGASRVSILLGNGMGGFGIATHFSVGLSAHSVAVGDFNLDNNLDFAATNANTAGPNGITIRLGNGLGGFGAASTISYSTPSQPFDVAVADFNGDGKPDLATVLLATNNISVLLGDGLGGFGAATNFGVGDLPTSLAIGDFNLDGKLDLASSNSLSDNISVLLGNGLGAFGTATNFAAGDSAESITTGDLNQDGRPDLVVSNRLANTVSVFLGNGMGGFGTATNFGVGMLPEQVRIGDFNLDGKPDLVTANATSDNASVLLGDGLGGFAAAVNFSFGDRPRSVAVADFNLDGAADLAVANGLDGTIGVRMNVSNLSPPSITAAGSLSRIQGTILSDPSNNSIVATVSDTNPGTLTVTQTSFPTGVNLMFFVNTNGTVTANVAAGCTAAVGANTVVLTVTNGTTGLSSTANLTVNVISHTTPTVTYNNASVVVGNATTVSPATGPTNNIDNFFGITVQSVTPSPAPATITVNNSTGVVSVPNNVPPGIYTITIRSIDTCGLTHDASFTLNVACLAITISPATLPNAAVGASYNQLLTANPAGPYSFAISSGELPKGLTLSTGGVISGTPAEFGVFNFMVRANGGTCMGSGSYTLSVTGANCAGFGFQNLPGDALGGTFFSVVAADFNKDGKRDVITGSNAVAIRLGNGDGTFAAPTTLTGGSANDLALGDFNLDGNTDLAVADFSASGQVRIYLGNGTGGFTGPVNFAAFNGTTSVVVADFNRDGKPDVVAFNQNSDQLRILLGDGTGNFAASALTLPENGSHAEAVALDFNKDGNPDIAHVLFGGTTMYLLLGDGLGGFTITTVTVGQGPIDVDTGDFNQDGNPDLVTANRQDKSLTILLGNGLGGFTQSTINLGGAASTSAGITVSDFNGDGKQDLAANLSGNPNVNVLLGNGLGGFSQISGSPFGVAASPYETAAADFNGDGKPDLAVAASNLSVLLNHCPPVITPLAVNVQQGSPVTVGASLGTATDDRTAPNLLTNMILSAPTGINITGLAVSAAGAITADVVADCSATPGANPVSIKFTDGGGLSTTTSFTVNVAANTAPTLNYPASASVAAGASTMVSPMAATDNVAITGYSIVSVVPPLATAPAVNGSGVISISGAAPVGAHIITIRATDNCGATTDANFTLTVNNNAPTIAAGAALTRQRGTAGSVSTIATVSDSETPVGSLVVTATTVPTGITVTSIINVNGTITANVTASCTATVGANTVVLTVNDSNSGTATANLTVNVTANTNPTLSYPAASVNAGSATTNSPTTATDNGSISSFAVQSQGTYTGTISVNASGVVSISNAGPVGAHIITIRATDNCGSTTDATFTLTVGNNPPTITAGAALSRQQGTAGSISTIATVSDSETPAGSLMVTATTVPTGITVTSIINVNGTITANVTASCTATVGANTVVLTVTDSNSGTATANLTVNVTANTNPTLSYPAASVNAGSATTNSPTTATDNGSISSFAVQSQGTYVGTISVNASGVVSISNAAPVGMHTITIRSTDNCNATTDATFTVTVGNNLPTITAGAMLTRQQGNPAANAPIATVSDNDTPAGSLTVTATTVPAGITVTGITNNNGTITASIAASCTATVGANTVVLTVTDSNNGMATANLTVNVTANAAPSLSYPISGVALNSATTITTTTATDNGSITGFSIVSVTPPLTTAPTVNTSGVVSVTNAAPFGLHTVTVRATDNCGATTEATFTLNVGCGSLTVTPATLINGLTFVPYSSTLSASGGSGSYTFTLASGTLPAGLNFSGNLISGTPNTAGASTFTIRATDDNGCFGERTYTLLIGSTGLVYYPLARPVRLLDTRPGASPNACSQPNAPIPGNTSRLQPARGTCEGLTIPPNATTITGNITTVQSGGGFLTIYPSDAPQPVVANTNYLPNETLNNSFTVGVGAQDGAVKIFVTSDTDVVVDVTGYYAPPTTGGLYFHPLPRPVRLLETRAGQSGCFAPAAPLPGGVITAQLGTGACAGLTIPPEALALVGNATTVDPAGEGYLTLYPANAAQPLVASSNYATGQTVNGPFTVGLAPSGQFNIFTLKTTDLVIDITGYYSAQANDPNGQGLLFTSLGSPLRLLDTRAGQQGCYTPGAPMTSGTVYTQATQSPCTNLTPTARALIGNATVVGPNGTGYLTFWPGDAQQPLVATSNFTAEQIFNRYFTVGLGPDGSFKRFASQTTNLVIDISGFFAP